MPTRRSFLVASGAAVSAAGANDRVRIGVIGAGGRGQHVMSLFLSYPDCSVAAVCDVYKPNAEKAAAAVRAAGGEADIAGDYRSVLDRKDIDAVLIGTPDHWHCPIVVAACEAGKDVYVEKPLSNAIEPCLQAIAAARKNSRVVQVGVQQRSYPHYKEAARLLREGLLGRVTQAPMLFPGGYGRAPEEPQAPPEGLDWNMFQGPAERRSYIPSRQRSWRSFYDYGGGLVTDWGVHLTDIVQWFLDDENPKTVAASAQYGRFPDPQQVPDVFSISWTYERFVSSFTNWAPNWSAPELDIGLAGNYFVGERGTLFINRGGMLARPNTRGPRGREAAAPFEPINFRTPREAGQSDEGTRLHVRNFLDCVRSRQKPAAEIETGFRSTLPTLLGLMAIRDRKMYAWNGKAARAL